LFLFGLSNQTQVTSSTVKVFRIDPATGLIELATPLPAVFDASVAWADFDGDGDLDLALTGSTNRVVSRPSNRDGVTQVFRNDRGVLTNLQLPLRGLSSGSIAWGDFDNDGYPDLLVTGVDTNTPPQPTSLIYRNLSGTNFVQFASLRGYTGGRGFWADFNNDGYTDVLLVGLTNTALPADYVPTLYLNQSGTNFLDIQSPLGGARLETAIGDFNGDGRLDLFLSGRVVTNNFEAANSLPAPPQSLHAEVLGNDVMLDWTPGLDLNQLGGHTFNLRVGTTSGGVDVMSPLADLSTGRRFVCRTGNAGEAPRWSLRGLAPGQYYWSAQAIDHAYAGSAFAPESTFVVEGGGPDGPISLSLKLLTSTRLTLTVSGPPDLPMAVESSGDLQDWIPVVTNRSPIGSFDLELETGNFPARFWRARKVP